MATIFISRYQLWIFDKDRDERYPVHGGVFDVPSGASEAVVRIQPRLSVPNATLFVVTVERPGGVWVSDRSRIPVLAKAKGYQGAKSRVYRAAKQQVIKSGQYAYRDRRVKKREYVERCTTSSPRPCSIALISARP